MIRVKATTTLFVNFFNNMLEMSSCVYAFLVLRVGLLLSYCLGVLYWWPWTFPLVLLSLLYSDSMSPSLSPSLSSRRFSWDCLSMVCRKAYTLSVSIILPVSVLKERYSVTSLCMFCNFQTKTVRHPVVRDALSICRCSEITMRASSHSTVPIRLFLHFRKTFFSTFVLWLFFS